MVPWSSDNGAVLDEKTGFPGYQVVLATHSAASVTWIVTELLRLKHLPQVFITDGLAVYQTVFGALSGR
jgi:hypothetical protein